MAKWPVFHYVSIKRLLIHFLLFSDLDFVENEKKITGIQKH